MNWFIHQTTRIKLFLSFGLMIFFLLVVIACAYKGMTTLHRSQDQLFAQDLQTALTLVEMRSDLNYSRGQLLEMTLTADITEQQEQEEKIEKSSKEVSTELSKIAELMKKDTAGAKAFEEMLSLLDEYDSTRNQQFTLIHAGRVDEARQISTSVQDERYTKIRKLALQLGQHAWDRANDRIAATDKLTKALTQTFFIIAGVVLLLSLGAALFLNRIIATPLVELTGAADRIAKGDPNVIIDVTERRDEVGGLTKAFRAMVDYLNQMAKISKQIAEGDLTMAVQPVSDRDVLGKAFVDMTTYLRQMAEVSTQIAGGDLAVTVKPASDRDILGKAFVDMTAYLRDMSSLSKQVAEGDLTVSVQPVSDRDVLGHAYGEMIHNLRKINQELSNSVSVLASSASEILASTTQIAAGMTETATSVSETTATVEEVKQTAQLSVEKSRNVSDSAQRAATVADRGSSAVMETMDGINHIKTLMETVAESVVMLSEQTQAIGEIITAVNDLAQQSNLLAVNAAIEASKAGEQGKGFAVVAQEIKSLADQSKQATEQVRSILNDIQKATGKSVLAAEQVSKAVENGVRQATESGESIKVLAGSIGESAQAAAQIAASSQQQLAGMEQVAMAMETIKQAAQQNVSGTKQVEQAAHTLNELGQKLKELVGTYKI